MAKCILRNDYWCKGLGQAQPKSDAWLQFREIRKARRAETAVATPRRIQESHPDLLEASDANA
jgi:hypothetical protein